MSNVETRPVEQTVCRGRLSATDENEPAAPGAPGPAPNEPDKLDEPVKPNEPGEPKGPDGPDVELLEPREVPLGGPRAMLVRRALPGRDRRMVGAWCFADSYGPTAIAGAAGMQVPPHPHIGLQTVSWLLEGEVWHQDSLGSRQMVRPGELNLMTAGAGIAHSEQSPPDHSATLHGVQLWVAQPEQDRNGPAHFDHHTDLPTLTEPEGTVTVLMGELAGAASPARTYTPLVGADVALHPGARLRLPLEPGFEHAVLALADPVTADGRTVPTGTLLYLGPGRREVLLTAETGTRALLLGGAPFEERLTMWWNFVARTHEEIVEARATWEAEREAGWGAGTAAGAGARFGAVAGYEGPALPAPRLPNAQLRARPRYRAR